MAKEVADKAFELEDEGAETSHTRAMLSVYSVLSYYPVVNGDKFNERHRFHCEVGRIHLSTC